jgi:predicted nucleic acid-binding protein
MMLTYKKKTGLDHKDLQWIYTQLIKQIRILPALADDVYGRNLTVAQGLAVHQEDAPYLAAALTLKCAIWSNDSDMNRQQSVPVITTSELIKIFQDSLNVRANALTPKG